jgi:hypothetical protein
MTLFRFVIGIAFSLVALAILFSPERETRAEEKTQIFREGFSGRQTVWLRGEDNVKAEEKDHELSEQFAHSLPTSERISLVVQQGTQDPSFAYYHFPTAPAPIAEELSASVWVKSTKAGVRLMARLVLPKERNPNKPDEPMTEILVGDAYKLTGRWQRLEIARPTKLVNDLQQKLKIQLNRAVDFTDAHIDRLTLNLYTSAGAIDVFIDDLEIGPVRQPVAPPPSVNKGATTTGIVKPPVRDDRGYRVEMNRNRLLVGGKPFFFRAIRHSGTPLKTLRDAGFNSVYFDIDTPGETLEEAIRHGFWVVPSLPLLPGEEGDGGTRLTGRNNAELTSARTPEQLASGISRFLSGDSVLFWDLGNGRATEQIPQVLRTSRAIQKADPNRPIGADVWDGFQDYAQPLQMIGSHRFPLMTSLELTGYRDWLLQRRYLAGDGKFTWTWIQTHLPEWQAKLLYDQSTDQPFKDPVGPQPEQIRLMTYLSLASGCKGLGFWSDKFLADSHTGRDRLLMMALLNQEIRMLEPVLLTLQKEPTWIDTSHPQVKAAVMVSEKGILVLPIWLGGGAQYVPPQGAVVNLSMIVPMIPDGTQPWEVSPGRVQSLQPNSQRVLGGTRLTIPEFDLTTAVVFTSDLSPNGLVVWWQNRSRQASQLAAEWMIKLSDVESDKVRKIHEQLQQLAPEVANAGKLIQEAERRQQLAREHEANGDYQSAYIEAQRALRPLRILMRAHWEQAVSTLDFPTASPYAASFYTLPRHWKMHRDVRQTRPGANSLKDGDFESIPNRPDFAQMPEEYRPQMEARLTSNVKKDESEEPPMAPKNGTVPEKPLPGLDLSNLKGWTVQKVTLDEVVLNAQLVPGWGAEEKRPPRPAPKRQPYDTSSPARRIEAPDSPEPTLGKAVLELSIKPKMIQKGNKLQPAPAALERTFLAVNSPAARFEPGTIVRISGWIRIPENIQASTDGVLFYDNTGGDGLGLRLTGAMGWKKFHFYRRVPASGVIWTTVALTGIGTVHFDDIRIEALTS